MLLPKQRWIAPFIILWSWGNLTFRNAVAPARLRAVAMAKSSRISGAYRDAQSKLSQHAERSKPISHPQLLVDHALKSNL